MKTNELTGPALDWAVAKADGKTPKIDCVSFQKAFIYRIYLGWSYAYSSNGSIVEYQPSTDWAQGGPIIEREKITLAWGEEEQNWFSCIGDSRAFDNDEPDGLTKLTALTPLIAAMRCYVASKLGDNIDIPEELT